MRIIWIGLAVLSVALVAPSFAEEKPTPALDHKATLAQLACLTGTWEGAMWGGTFRAQYCPPSADTLLSYSRLRMGRQVRFFEFEVFELVGSKLTLTPHPKGAPASKFTLVAYDAAEKMATFDAPQNDFPSRIVYHVKGDALTIKLTDPHHKSGKSETFALRRVQSAQPK